MKKILSLLFISLIVISAAFTQNPDAVYKKLVKEYTLNPDGSASMRVYKELKFISFLAMNRLYGETFIVYNPQYQTLKINSSYTIMNDGKKVVNPENAFNEVLPGFAADAPYFNGLREMVVTHTGLDLGATVFLDYTVETRSEYYPYLMGLEVIGESSPVENYEVIINIPQGKKLNYKILNLTQPPDRQTVSGKDSYRWLFKSVPALSSEPLRERDLNSTPQISFSTVTHQELMNWMGSFETLNPTLNKELTAKADELAKGETDELKIILKVNNWLNTNIETVNVPALYYGYKPRLTGDVYQSAYATRLEKAVLMSALLNYLKMNAQPVFVANTSYFDQNIGNVHLFNEIQVQVITKNYATLFLTPSGKNSANQKYLLAGKSLVPWTANSTSGIQPVEAEENNLDLSAKITWNKDGNSLDGKLEFELKGAANPWFDLFQDSTALTGLISGGLSGKDINTIKMGNFNEYIAEGTAMLKKEKAFRNQDNFWFFTLPVFRNGLESFQLAVLNESRKSPLELPYPIDEDYVYEISIPKGMKMVNKPVNMKMENELGTLHIAFEQNGDIIKITRKLELKKKVIFESQYPQFKSMLDEWNVLKYRQLIIQE